MALATPTDAKRYIPDYSASDDVALEAQLEAAAEWVERKCGRDWDASGSVTETFYDVRDGEILTLKDESPSSLTAKSYLSHDSDGLDMTVNTEYHVREGGKVEIIFVRYGAPQGLPEARVELRPTTFARIEVTYTASGTVPTPVREAVAMVAAAWYLDATAGAVAGDIISERMGDYSYTREASGARLPIPNRAMTLLTPWNKRLRVRST